MIGFNIKRIYAAPSPDDGYRILVDRLWPRGIKKEDAHLDEWNKEVAPSTSLRKWFDHDPARFAKFSAQYREELIDKTEALDKLRRMALEKKVTLLYAAKNENINHAVILLEILDSHN